jgi:hypothetical protein
MKTNFALLGLMLITLVGAQGQTYRSTIRPGTQTNSVFFAIRPSANTLGVRISSLNIPIGVPASVTPKPTVTIRNNLNTNISYTIQVVDNPEPVAGKGNYHVYNILGDGAQTVAADRSFVSSSDNDIIEIEFSNGGAFPPITTAEVLLLSIPDGGTTFQSNFYISDKGSDVTDLAAMFYGAGAVNGPGGYSGTSFVGASNIALPVKFLSFYAMKNDDNARLNWTVEGDELNKYFEVERSTDGRTYRKLNQVAALNNGKSTNTYEATDAGLSKLGSNSVFYRIKQVDKSGEISYSQIRNLNAAKKGSSVTLFPNPAKTTTKLTIDADQPGKVTILIRDVSGKLARQVNVQVNTGINLFDLNVADLASGEYVATVAGDGLNQQLKFAKID